MSNSSIWHRKQEVSNTSVPIYIAVGGNTGSGKSTLLGEISREFSSHFNTEYLGIDERNFHHPLLTKMFFDPSQYALHIQLNFMLQRCTYIFHALQNRLPSVMERCHFEDAIFIDDHFLQGNISELEYDAYKMVRDVLWAKLRSPDIYVRVLVEPEVSIERIRKDELQGKRPEEFPSDESFRGYVERWYGAYEKFFIEIDNGSLSEKFSDTIIIDVDPSKTPAESAANVLSKYLGKGT
jgi:deoxyadenosine/deoxycytidine kinase